MLVFNSLLKQGLLSIDESTLSFENGKLSVNGGGGGGGGNYLPLSGGTVEDNFAVLPLGTTTSMGVPAYGLQVSSTYGLQLFGTHFLNGTLWGEDGLKIVNNNLSLTSLDEAFISSDYANTTTFRAMPNDGTQATYKFEGWGWDDDSHTSKSPRLGVRLLKPNQATPLEATSVLNMEEGDARWVSGTNIKTINGESLIGSGDITISGGGGGLENLATGANALSILGDATTSTNSVTIGATAGAYVENSIALGYNAIAGAPNSTAVGSGAYIEGIYSTAVGDNTYAGSDYSTALGASAAAGAPNSTALGAKSSVTAFGSTAIGYAATSFDAGTIVLSAWNDSSTAKTQLYLIGAGSTMSTTYCDGEAGLGFVSKDSNGNVLKRGTIKLSALCTENTDTFNPSGW